LPTCLITGASRGLGYEFTRQYAAEGWHVIATCRAPDVALALTNLALETSELVTIEAMDVTNFSQINAVGQRLSGTPIDLLINNAGIARSDLEHQRVGTLDFDGWLDLLRTNTLAPVKVTEVFLENVAASEQKKIISISSTVGSMQEVNFPVYPYATSKAALNKAMLLMADQFSEREIIVANLCPGHAKTDMGLMAEGATVEVADSVSGMREVISNLTIKQSGAFIRYNGETIAW